MKTLSKNTAVFFSAMYFKNLCFCAYVPSFAYSFIDGIS